MAGSGGVIDVNVSVTYHCLLNARHWGRIMQTKLTLRLEDVLIQQAKTYAKQHDKSLSQVVSDYFKVLTRKDKKLETPPITRSLIGILESAKIGEDDYKKYLEEKYL